MKSIFFFLSLSLFAVSARAEIVDITHKTTQMWCDWSDGSLELVLKKRPDGREPDVSVHLSSLLTDPIDFDVSRISFDTEKGVYLFEMREAKRGRPSTLDFNRHGYGELRIDPIRRRSSIPDRAIRQPVQACEIRGKW